LMLFPAAFLIVLVLGAIAIDAGVAFMRQRELAAAAGAAANDAIGVAVDETLTRQAGELRIDPVALERAVLASLARRQILDTLSEPPQVRMLGDDSVEVTLARHADYVIAPALPGERDGVIVHATATATLVIDDG